MRQVNFIDTEYSPDRKQAIQGIFVAGVDRDMPLKLIEGRIKPVYPEADNGRRLNEFSVMVI